MKVDQLKIKTNAGADYIDLSDKLKKYADVIVLTSPHYRNEDKEWQTTITIEISEND
jgi:hypothetical protein